MRFPDDVFCLSWLYQQRYSCFIRLMSCLQVHVNSAPPTSLLLTPMQGPPPAVASTIKFMVAARRQLLLFVMIAVVFAFSEASRWRPSRGWLTTFSISIALCAWGGRVQSILQHTKEAFTDSFFYWCSFHGKQTCKYVTLYTLTLYIRVTWWSK